VKNFMEHLALAITGGAFPAKKRPGLFVSNGDADYPPQVAVDITGLAIQPCNARVTFVTCHALPKAKALL
jgi:hypothetical protein